MIDQNRGFKESVSGSPAEACSNGVPSLDAGGSVEGGPRIEIAQGADTPETSGKSKALVPSGDSEGPVSIVKSPYLGRAVLDKAAACLDKPMDRRKVLTTALTVTTVAGATGLLYPSTPAYASVPKGPFNQTDKLETWNQNEGEWGQYSVGGWFNMATAGCAIFAGAFLLRKSGIKGKGFTPIDLVKEGEQKNWTGTYVGSGGMATWGNLGNGKFQYAGLQDAASSGKAMEDHLKKAHNDGYFLIMNVSASPSPVNGNVGIPNHYIAMDKILDDGKIQYFDSGLYATKFEDGYTNSGGRLIGFHKYKLEGKKPQECIDLFGGAGQAGGSKDDKGKSDKGAKGSDDSKKPIGMAKPYPKEKDLVGMGKMNYASKSQAVQTVMASPVPGNKDFMALQDLQEEIDINREQKKGGLVRTGISLSGFALMMAGLMWFMFGMMDMALNTRTVGTITKGRREYSSVRGVGDNARGWGNLTYLAALMILTGGFLAAGMMTGFIYDIFEWFTNFFS